MFILFYLPEGVSVPVQWIKSQTFYEHSRSRRTVDKIKEVERSTGFLKFCQHF